MSLKRVVIMAGGTGGHVYPGLAITKRLQEDEIEVYWIGTSQGLEASLVPNAHIPIHFILVQGLRRNGIKRKLLAPWHILSAVRQAYRILKGINPDLALGMGGFVSGPGGIAAWLLGKKLIIHEQNAKPGFTNQCLALCAEKILEAFPGTFRKRKKVLCVGNPVREEIISFAPPEERFKTRVLPIRLLIFGGSLGSLAINTLVPQALVKMDPALRPQIYHQTGERHYEETLQRYQAASLDAKIVPFIQDMDKAYAWADIVVCRAGALTVSELCMAGLGAILIPYPFAVDDHQTANADVMVRTGAAILAPEATLNPEVLASMLNGLCASIDECLRMAKAAYLLRTPHATEKILTLCKEICS